MASILEAPVDTLVSDVDRPLARRLEALVRVGLGHVSLGQPPLNSSSNFVGEGSRSICDSPERPTLLEGTY